MSIIAMKQALQALEFFCEYGAIDRPFERIAELKQAIAETEKQEPVAWMCEANVFGSGGWKRSLCFVRNDNECFRNWEPLFAAPVHASDISQEPVDETAKDKHEWVEQPDLAKVGEVGVWGHQRKWVGLTDEEIKEIVGPWGPTPIKGYTRKLFDQIESKLKEKNGG